MGGLKLGQAIRNAIEVERSAARFYRLLKDSTSDAEAQKFLERIAVQEEEHAVGIERLAKLLDGGQVPIRADDEVDTVETAPEWRFVDELSFAQAMRVALEAETHAALYYDALADGTRGDVAEFFRGLARNEEGHVQLLQRAIREGRGVA